MFSEEIRQKFLRFFEEKKHKIVPSSSLLSSDPSVLLTTAGMQQFKSCYLGKSDPLKDFGGPNVVSIQKCFRTTDIEAVGDETHLTFFEMLGNFSFIVPAAIAVESRGGYFKKEAIAWGWEFLTRELGIAPERLAATYFDGDKEAVLELRKHFPAEKIKAAGKEDNFWGPTGNEGPCGPTVEFYADGVEVWNLVFNQYYCQKDERMAPLDEMGGRTGVDTGMGLERLVAVLERKNDVFKTDLFEKLMTLDFGAVKLRVRRILADHLRAVIFLIADGLRPSNKEAGSILRRLLRRILAYKILFQIKADIFQAAAAIVAAEYGSFYPEVKETGRIGEVLEAEEVKFFKTISQGLAELKKFSLLTAPDAFTLYETFGLPYELIKEFGETAAKALRREDFEKEFQKHQEISRAGAVQKFGGHGLDEATGEVIGGLTPEEIKRVVRLHTATHLLNQALHDVLGKEIQQAGSDINPERTRFDFIFGRKLIPEELKRIEDIVNKKIDQDLPVLMKEMPKETALQMGVRSFRPEKYPPIAKVYLIGGDEPATAYSKEFCGGPHVQRTGQIGSFQIIKEEAVSGGIRRIRGTVSG